MIGNCLIWINFFKDLGGEKTPKWSRFFDLFNP